ncbi:hypothetical protein K7X08_033181 [Anisodus acutangulus]|uniref:Pentatricopeptide repeat-containing protein n=1 Tax=Anisodus acutangulus TaxID=402998 RepID=A0A9Q1M146_9SOLA|nr:hypothetical protein K7X08_033181 [Anisodus acutangulus]
MPQRDHFTYALMITCYARSGELEKARNVFELLPDKSNIACWNAMITGYTKAGRMYQRSAVAYTTMIDGYFRAGKLKEARDLLDQMPYKNVGARTAMISGYIQNNRVDEARRVFDRTATRDVVCWNTMIAGYAQCGRVDEAFDLFEKMEPKSIVVWNTMMAGYAQVGQMEKAIEIFENMGERNVISWNSLISGYAKNGFYVDALEYFIMMIRDGKKPDRSTFASALSSCSNLAAERIAHAVEHFNVLFTLTAQMMDMGLMPAGCKVALHDSMADGKITAMSGKSFASATECTQSWNGILQDVTRRVMRKLVYEVTAIVWIYEGSPPVTDLLNGLVIIHASKVSPSPPVSEDADFGVNMMQV